jgi:hypothetical protein
VLSTKTSGGWLDAAVLQDPTGSSEIGAKDSTLADKLILYK